MLLFYGGIYFPTYFSFVFIQMCLILVIRFYLLSKKTKVWAQLMSDSISYQTRCQDGFKKPFYTQTVKPVRFTAFKGCKNRGKYAFKITCVLISPLTCSQLSRFHSSSLILILGREMRAGKRLSSFQKNVYQNRVKKF